MIPRTSRPAEPASQADCEEWLRKLATKQTLEPAQRTEWDFAVCLCEDDAAIGCVALHTTDRAEREAVVEYMIARRCWGRGYAQEALGAMLRFATAPPRQMSRVSALIVASNVASMKVARRCGMKKISSSDYELNGRARSIVIYALDS